MTTNIQFVHIKTSETLESYTLKKLDLLAKKYSWLINAQVFFKKENKMNEKACICEIQLSLPGSNLFASANEKNFEMAVKETIAELNKKLQKRKGQMKPYM